MEERLRGKVVRREYGNLGIGELKGTTKHGWGEGWKRSTKQSREEYRKLKGTEKHESLQSYYSVFP